MTGGRTSPGPVLRLFEVYFGAVILFWLAYALPAQGHTFALDLGALWILAQLVAAAVSFWLIEGRARLARPFVIASSAVVMCLSLANAALGTTAFQSISQGGLPGLLSFVLVCGPIDIAAIAYFSLSRRVRDVLREPLVRVEEEDRDQDARISAVSWRTWPFWRDLALFYCVFSLVGHWAEMGFCQLIRLGVVGGDFDPSNSMLWDQWLYPFPAEGLAVVLIILFLHPLKEWLLKRFGGRRLPALAVSFLANAAVCTSIDFLTGVTANANYQLWDYRSLPFNFMGQICLQNSVIYSVAATIVAWVVYPWLAGLVRRVPNNVMNGVFVGMAAVYAFLELVYVVNVSAGGIVLG